MQRKIVWESQHYEFNSVKGQLVQEPIDSDLLEEDGIPSIPVGKILETPAGFFTVDDSMNPFRQFQFWMGHTNFSLGPKAVGILKRIPGVEVLKIITRYRFLIGIGKLFKLEDVHIYINKVLCGNENVLSESNEGA